MFIKSLEREIEIGVKTRKISRLVNEELMKGVMVTDMQNGEMEFPVVNIDRSTELAVRLMTGLSQDEIDKLENHEYEEIKAEVNKVQDTPR